MPGDADVRPKGSTLEEVVADQARTIARLVGLLEKSGRHDPPATISTDAARPLVTNLPKDDSSPSAPVASVREVESTIPQRGIYASSRLSERLSASYNESMTVRFTGTISIEKMTHAMERLVARHDALRASFDEAGLVMKVAPTRKIPLLVTDLSAITESIRQEERLGKLIAAETSLPFSLPAGPLFRCQMVLLATRSRCRYLHGAPYHLRRLVAGCPDPRSLRFLFRGHFGRARIPGAGSELRRLRTECNSTRPLGRIQGSRELLAFEIRE